MKNENPRTAIEMNWIPAFAGMTDEEKINRGFREKNLDSRQQPGLPAASAGMTMCQHCSIH
jgi:hypothetical protein